MARARGSRARPKSEVRVAGDRRTAVSCGQPFGQPTRSAVGCGDEREPGGGVSVGHDADKLAKRLTTPRQPQSNGADGHTDNFGNLVVGQPFEAHQQDHRPLFAGNLAEGTV
jgi:hypothetical protein